MIKYKERLNGINSLLIQCVENISSRTKLELNRDIIVVFGYRSPEQQQALYNQGRTSPGKIVTNAKSGQSAHEYYAAVDIWIMSENNKTIDWNNKNFPKIIKEEVEKIKGLTWGGNFKSIKDMPHIELTNWKSLRK